MLGHDLIMLGKPKWAVPTINVVRYFTKVVVFNYELNIPLNCGNEDGVYGISSHTKSISDGLLI